MPENTYRKQRMTPKLLQKAAYYVYITPDFFLQRFLLFFIASDEGWTLSKIDQ
jgi:hypothetical protein